MPLMCVPQQNAPRVCVEARQLTLLSLASSQEADDAKAGAGKWKRGGQRSDGHTSRQHATRGDRMEQGTDIDVRHFLLLM